VTGENFYDKRHTSYEDEIMQVIQQAIYDFAKADSGASGLWPAIGGTAATNNGRLYFTEAPQETIFPYIVFSKPSGIPEYTFTTKLENTLYQFTIFSDKSSASEINDIFTKLVDLFDLATLSPTGWVNFQCIREIDFLERIEGIWTWYVQYRIRIEANR